MGEGNQPSREVSEASQTTPSGRRKDFESWRFLEGYCSFSPVNLGRIRWPEIDETECGGGSGGERTTPRWLAAYEEAEQEGNGMAIGNKGGKI